MHLGCTRSVATPPARRGRARCRRQRLPPPPPSPPYLGHKTPPALCERLWRNRVAVARPRGGCKWLAGQRPSPAACLPLPWMQAAVGVADVQGTAIQHNARSAGGGGAPAAREPHRQGAASEFGPSQLYAKPRTNRDSPSPQCRDRPGRPPPALRRLGRDALRPSAVHGAGRLLARRTRAVQGIQHLQGRGGRRSSTVRALLMLRGPPRPVAGPGRWALGAGRSHPACKQWPISQSRPPNARTALPLSAAGSACRPGWGRLPLRAGCRRVRPCKQPGSS